jgi:hypothetical protein
MGLRRTINDIGARFEHSREFDRRIFMRMIDSETDNV